MGRVHSIETMSGVDGPGVRCVVFLQGCPLKCLYCQNPDTQPANAGREMSAEEVVQNVLRYRPYFGRQGGVTLSGGEPFAQAQFAAEVLAGCKEQGVSTAVDTSGYFLNDTVKAALDNTDLVLLDIKHTDPARHMELTGVELERTLRFLQYLTDTRKPTWLRQVIVPGWNDTKEDISALAKIANQHKNIARIDLLPYHKLATEKYQALGIEPPLADTPETSDQTIETLQKHLASLWQPVA